MRIGKTRTLSRFRRAMPCRPLSSFVMGLALEDDKLLRVTGSNDLVDKSVDVIDTPTPASFPVAQRLRLPNAGVPIAFNILDKLVDSLERLFVLNLPSGIFVPGSGRKKNIHDSIAPYASRSSRRFASPRSYERMDSPSMRWFASEKNGSGLTAMTSNGRRWRRTDCLRNRRTALDRSSPARANSSSASCLRSESTRICNVDVVISKSFVVQCADSISHSRCECNEDKKVRCI